MKYVRLKAYGKINLSLDITGRRDDGYHLVRMIMQTVDIYDRIYMERTAGPDIVIETNLSFIPKDSSNIVYKAIDLVRTEYGITDGVFVNLKKFIPVSAGMGGGSADAAAALKGMNKLFNLKMSKDKMLALATKLGADVPYCLEGGTVLSEGIGEVLTQIAPVPSCKLVIVKPKVSASTKHIYSMYDSVERTYHPNVDAMIDAIGRSDVKGMCSALGNVLEEVTTEECPVIKDIEADLLEKGALGAMMSGSGTTVFGIFPYEIDTEQIKEELKRDTAIRSVYDARFMVLREGELEYA